MKCYLRKALHASIVVSMAVWMQLAVSADFPSAPIRLIVPYAAGGTTDQMARIIQPRLGEILGVPIIVENKPGAGGAIGVDYVARSPNDGYTLVFGNSGPNSIAPIIKKVPYDPLRDLKPISSVVVVPMILAVSSSFPANNIKEFISYAKTQAVPLTYGSTGLGGFSHLTTEYFKKAAGIKGTHIPYKGGGPGVLALRSGEIQMMFVTPLDGEAQHRANEIKYLGLSSAERSGLLPGVPAIAESLPGFVSEVWFGVLAPKDTPDAIINKLHAAIQKATEDPAIMNKFAALKVVPKSSTPDWLGKTIAHELKHWGELVKELGIAFQ